MKVRRFFAPDMSQAMRIVREEVGPDAVILSSNRVAGGVEVVVALEYEAPTARPGSLREAGQPGRRERQLSALTGGRAGRKRNLDGALAEAGRRIAEGKAWAQGELAALHGKGKNRQIELDDRAWDEVLAHVERQQSRSGDARAEAREAGVPPAPKAGAREVAGPDPAQQALKAMRAEIEELKAMLRERAPEAVEAPACPAVPAGLQAELMRRFAELGVVEKLARRLVQGVEPDMDPARAWKVVLARLADALPAIGEDLIERGGVIAFVGPTGVGKTTTIGKLAARYVLRHGSSGIGLVTTDSNRIAAHEQLRTFGRILDVPVRIVDENRALDDALESLRDKRLILIDTAGMGGDEQQRAEQLAMLTGARKRIKKLLVLPATAQPRVLSRAYEQVRELGLHGVVLSKLDEAVSLGEIISAVIEYRLPLAYLADGQRVPDNIDVARATALVSRAVVMADKQADRRTADGGAGERRIAGVV